MTEQNSTPPEPASENPEVQPSDASAAAAAEGAEADVPETAEEEIDLNHLFPDEETDLNELFPEPEMRTLLKKVSRNTKDLGKMKDRFSDTFQERD